MPHPRWLVPRQGVKREKFHSLKIQIGIARERAKDSDGIRQLVVVDVGLSCWLGKFCFKLLVWFLGPDLVASVLCSFLDLPSQRVHL